MRGGWLSTVAAALFTCATLAPPLLDSAQAQKVSRIRASVRGTSNTTRKSNSGSSKSPSRSGGQGATYQRSAGNVRASGHSGKSAPPVAALWLAYFTPWAIPHYAMGDSIKRPAWFAGYPYADGTPGAVWIQRTDKLGQKLPAPKGLRPLSLQMSFESSYDASMLHRFTGSLRLDTAYRVGLEGSWSYFWDTLKGGDAETLWSGDANVIIRFAQTERALMYTGAGARFMVDGLGVVPGFNLTYGLEAYPIRPLVVGFSIDMGNLGEAFVVHGRATVGAVLGRVEAYLGYDALKIAETVVHGPIAGLRYYMY